MNWRIKAIIQNFISVLPSKLSYEVYYRLQRNFGALKRVNPVSRLTAGIETWDELLKQKINPDNKVFFEIGTGRIPLVPISLWLLGAKKITTIDLNPYLKDELIKETLLFIHSNKNFILSLYGKKIKMDRFNELFDYSTNLKNFDRDDFLELCKIEYIAPGDASHTSIDDNTIDFITSYAVFEHIQPNILVDILKEGKRIIKNEGFFIHKIDYSDHFSHTDKNLTSINFLKYSEAEWNKIAGNKYMYMNRLRHDDYIELFESAGHNIVSESVEEDENAGKCLLNNSINLHSDFNDKSFNNLIAINSWIISNINKE